MKCYDCGKDIESVPFFKANGQESYNCAKCKNVSCDKHCWYVKPSESNAVNCIDCLPLKQIN